MPLRTRIWAFVSLLALCACGGSGPYNFTRNYEPLQEEQAHFTATEQQIAFEDVQRDPNAFKSVELGWFGVITSYGDLADGRQRLQLSLRSHQPRHLCGDERDSSCRVTVSERSLGSFTIDLALSAEQKLGKDRVWVGSLLKVYGTPTGDFDDEGAPVLAVKYFRHFPRGTYVTTAQRDAMRR